MSDILVVLSFSVQVVPRLSMRIEGTCGAIEKLPIGKCKYFLTYFPLNSQLIQIKSALRSKFAFVFLASLIPLSLFLNAGFVSVSVVWFFALCVYNAKAFDWNQLRSNVLLLLPVLLYLLGIVGLLYADNTDVGINLVLRKVHLMALPLAFLLAAKVMTREAYTTTLPLFVFSCLIASFVCFASAIINVVSENSFILEHGDVRYHYFLSHLLTRPLDLDPVYVSLYCNFALLVALNSTFIRSIIYKLIVALYLFLFIILCSSNAGIVSGVLIFILWLCGIGYRRLVIYASAAAFVGLVVGFSMDEAHLRQAAVDSFAFTYSDDAGRLSDYTANKLVIWDAAIAAIAEGPIIGYGTGDGQSALESELMEQGLMTARRDALNAHNQFFSTTLDLGLAGVVTLLLMLVLPVVRAIKGKNLLMLGFLLMVGMFFCIESVLLRQKGIVFIAFFYSLLVTRQDCGVEGTEGVWRKSSLLRVP